MGCFASNLGVVYVIEAELTGMILEMDFVINIYHFIESLTCALRAQVSIIQGNDNLCP
jgi:hypothetical protein